MTRKLILLLALLCAACTAKPSQRPDAHPGANTGAAPAAAVAKGVVDAEGGLIGVRVPREGVVTRLMAEVGDHGAAGQPLAALDARQASLAMAAATAELADRNAQAQVAAARAEGAETVDLGIAADTIAATTEGIRRARDAGADILITTGGASVGDHDLVKASLEAEGVDMTFWRIAMRPGKPMMHGRLGPMRVIGLPGNPVSSYVCGFLFLVPLIRALSGRANVHHPRETALLGSDLAANDQREDYLRARLEARADGTLVAMFVNHQDSSLLGNLAAARALVIRPPFAPAAAAGARCEFLRLPD